VLKSLTLAFTGDGPDLVAGGVVLRALGQGLSVLVCPLDDDGAVFRQLQRINLPGRLSVWPCPGVLRRWLTRLSGATTAGEWDMIVLQPVERLLAEDLGGELAALLRARPPGLHVVLAGRGNPGALLDEADLVTCFERRK
jgi:ATP:corrinoid adenosyltransferase